MKYFLWIVTVSTLLFLFGCPVSPIDTLTNPGFETDGTIGVDSTLFSITATEEVTFETNDPNYWTDKGYTLWALTDTVTRDFTSFDVTFTKNSGNPVAGYGAVVNYRDDATYGEVMLVVMINNDQEYIVGEVISGVFTALIPWTKATVELSPGYGQANRVQVAYNSGTEVFTLTINGTDVTTFTDTEAPFHITGRGGYMVVISPLDQFPTIPVEVVFTNHP